MDWRSQGSVEDGAKLLLGVKRHYQTVELLPQMGYCVLKIICKACGIRSGFYYRGDMCKRK